MEFHRLLRGKLLFQLCVSHSLVFCGFGCLSLIYRADSWRYIADACDSASNEVIRIDFACVTCVFAVCIHVCEWAHGWRQFTLINETYSGTGKNGWIRCRLLKYYIREAVVKGSGKKFWYFVWPLISEVCCRCCLWTVLINEEFFY